MLSMGMGPWGGVGLFLQLGGGGGGNGTGLGLLGWDCTLGHGSQRRPRRGGGGVKKWGGFIGGLFCLFVNCTSKLPHWWGGDVELNPQRSPGGQRPRCAWNQRWEEGAAAPIAQCPHLSPHPMAQRHPPPPPSPPSPRHQTEVPAVEMGTRIGQCGGPPPVPMGQQWSWERSCRRRVITRGSENSAERTQLRALCFQPPHCPLPSATDWHWDAGWGGGGKGKRGVWGYPHGAASHSGHQ